MEGSTYKCLSAKGSFHLNVETEPRESPMCSFTRTEIIPYVERRMAPDTTTDKLNTDFMLHYLLKTFTGYT